MTLSEGISSNKLPYSGTSNVIVSNGTRLPIHHVGQASLATSAKPLTLKNVLHVSNLNYYLLSVQQLCRDNNHEVSFNSSFVYIKDK